MPRGKGGALDCLTDALTKAHAARPALNRTLAMPKRGVRALGTGYAAQAMMSVCVEPPLAMTATLTGATVRLMMTYARADSAMR